MFQVAQTGMVVEREEAMHAVREEAKRRWLAIRSTGRNCPVGQSQYRIRISRVENGDR